jgi:UDP-N-acetylmuramoyl-L-alanyl-D-glutamate--2,6-diaminopimelate ligase
MSIKLKDILAKVKAEQLIGSNDIDIDNVCFDSRLVGDGDLFVAVKGVHVDGHQYIAKAIQQGAVAIVCEHFPEELSKLATIVVVADSAKALGFLASAYFDYPSEKMKVVGVTGTNGKTSIVFLLYQLFTVLGYKCGMLSTIDNRVGSHKFTSTHTTADAIQINSNLKAMLDEGCDYCFMEVSSHAIHQERIAGMKFYGGVFTNITHDHLDYHLSFDNYIKAKKSFFDALPKTAFALTNYDDRNGKVMLQNTNAKKVAYSIKGMSDFKGRVIESRIDGIELRIDNKDLWSRLVGGFNAYNLLAVYAAAILDGQDQDEVLRALSALSPAEGRFQLVPNTAGITAIVDYAHTPDALKNVLETIQALRTGNEKVCTVIGAGGDRDKGKRPVMAQLACNMSNHVILTSDNPRTEDPQLIIEDMEAGLDPVQKRIAVSITDRREAIKTACMISMDGDIILVAGKGHETYQEINGVKNHFDDREVLGEFLNEKRLK